MSDNEKIWIALVMLYAGQNHYYDDGRGIESDVMELLDSLKLAIRVDHVWHITEEGHNTVKSMFAGAEASQYGFWISHERGFYRP